jgi:hypothetical protein
LKKEEGRKRGRDKDYVKTRTKISISFQTESLNLNTIVLSLKPRAFEISEDVKVSSRLERKALAL